MSRIGNLPINIPAGVDIKVNDKGLVTVKGKNGELKQQIVDDAIKVNIEGAVLNVTRETNQKRHRSLHGLYRALIANMVQGVSEGFRVEQEIYGVGFKVENRGQVLILTIGYSHPVYFVVPNEIKLETKMEKGSQPTIILTGCDKQLIYRYFGGLEGLIDAIGGEIATWVEDSLAATGQAPPATYAELTERLILGFREALRANALVQKIAAWEIAESSPLVARLAAARGAALSRWMALMRGGLAPPDGLDAPALNAMLIAAVQQLALSGAAAGSFAGLPLKTDEDWDRVRAAAVRIVRGLYAG